MGCPAPDLTLTNTKGESVALSSLWAVKPLILVFLRHYGCAFCKEQVFRLRTDHERIVAAGADVVCVAMGPHTAGRAFQIVMQLPFDILATGDSIEPFRAYGLGRASIWQLLSPVLWARILRNAFRGFVNKLNEAQGDLAQMSGAFVVGTDGKFTYVNPAWVAYAVVPTDELLRSLPKVA